MSAELTRNETTSPFGVRSGLDGAAPPSCPEWVGRIFHGEPHDPGEAKKEHSPDISPNELCLIRRRSGENSKTICHRNHCIEDEVGGYCRVEDYQPRGH